MTHINAPLTPVGRLRLARLIVEDGWSTRRAAERFQVSPATASKWASRYRSGLSMSDLSSRPHTSPTRTSRRLEHRIVSLRFTRRRGPHRIGYHLGVARSTVEHVLARYRIPRLANIDQATGLPVIGNRHNKKKGHGYSFLHHAVDDHSRLAYSEILADEKKETAACYRSKVFNDELGDAITHTFTRLYRPQTNGKVERFNRTLAAEWAYADTYLPDDTRAATYQTWVHDYNHHRPHTGIGDKPPIERVHNVPRNYT